MSDFFWSGYTNLLWPQCSIPTIPPLNTIFIYSTQLFSMIPQVNYFRKQKCVAIKKANIQVWYAPMVQQGTL